MMKKISEQTNIELEEYKELLKQDFTLAKKELIFRAKHLENIKKEYLKVLEELKLRYGIKT
tara:strand:- start:34351 stop:34533 length:183 start_codon:yes stop_codon:yes gene_type:complete